VTSVDRIEIFGPAALLMRCRVAYEVIRSHQMTPLERPSALERCPAADEAAAAEEQELTEVSTADA
jgi:hypothetical protein